MKKVHLRMKFNMTGNESWKIRQGQNLQLLPFPCRIRRLNKIFFPASKLENYSRIWSMMLVVQKVVPNPEIESSKSIIIYPCKALNWCNSVQSYLFRTRFSFTIYICTKNNGLLYMYLYYYRHSQFWFFLCYTLIPWIDLDFYVLNSFLYITPK